MDLVRAMDDALRREVLSRLGPPALDTETVGTAVTVPTDRGPVVGIHLGNALSDDPGPVGIVYIPVSGSLVQVPLGHVESAGPEGTAWIYDTLGMAEAVRRAEAGIIRESRGRCRGPLVDSLLARARALGMTVDDVGAFYKVGRTPGRTVYLSRNGRRLDLTGFTVEHPLVRPIGAEEARDRRLGRVRGQVLDVSTEELPGVFEACLAGLVG